MHYCYALDHNNFVGAAEIRHILVCMGEMITDEEIDMMISMVDMDGDGQVRLSPSLPPLQSSSSLSLLVVVSGVCR